MIEEGKGLRVGLFSSTYPGINGEGGIGTYTRSLALGLVRLGHEVHVLTTGIDRAVDRDGVIIHPARADYFPLIDRALPGAGACYNVGRAMLRLVDRYSIQLAEFPNWDGLAVYYALRRRVPLVVRLHTSSKEAQRIDKGEDSRRLRFDVRREYWSAHLADALVTHSVSHRTMMAEELGVAPARLEVIPHGIDFVDAATATQVERDPNVILFLGRLETRKGALDLLKAAPMVLEAVPAARFYLIGHDRAHCPGGRTHAEYLRESVPEEVRSRITLLGRLPTEEVERWMRRASIFVAPSVYESFGLVLLEAMRWGTPVVSTRVGGIPEVIEDGKSGVLVSPNAPGEVAAALVRLLRDPVLREQIGQNGRDRCRTLFSTDEMATRAANFYRNVIERWSCK